MDDEEFLYQKLAFGTPSGDGRDGQEFWVEAILPYVDKVEIDTFTNAVATVRGRDNSKRRVVVDAHMDEVGWYVKDILKDGYLHVEDTGGSDVNFAPAHRVTIKTEKHGLVPAVFGWPAVHTRNEEQNTALKTQLFVDCGCTVSELALLAPILIMNTHFIRFIIPRAQRWKQLFFSCFE